jgi:hypothetical protein
MARSYIRAVKDRILVLQSLGLDVTLRYNSGLMGLSTRDESRDWSVLYRPKEMLIYLTGFQVAYLNRHVLRLDYLEPSPPPKVDSIPPGSIPG